MVVHNKTKSIIKNVLKIGFALLLILWMLSSGKLDFSKLSIIISEPKIIVASFFTWLFAVIFLQSIRWYLLLTGANYKITLQRTVKLTFIGLFFNTAMPGSVGGDLIKVIYVIRDNRNRGKTPALMTVLLDRLVGFFGLFVMGFTLMMFNIREIWSNILLRPLVGICAAFLCIMIIMYVFVKIPFKDDRDPFLKFFSMNIPGMKTLQKIYRALRQYHHKSSYLVYGLVLSIMVQCAFFLCFVIIATTMTDMSHAKSLFSTLGVVFPIGVLTAALPISPGGFGVGHVAFEQLFNMVGLSNGANIYNVFFLCQLVLNLLGAFSYIFERKPVTSEEQAAIEKSAEAESFASVADNLQKG
ncbi:MAG: flippase-like domain-containing protein [Oligoflexales bacterium]|nr:flippase-like domain-containing protein [Oligoflexales bacterium]